MATKHDRCGKCGERFESLDLLFEHFTTYPNSKCLTAEAMEALGWRRWYGVWREPLQAGEITD